MSLVIDSSGWIEFFGAGPKMQKYSRYILGSEEILVPSLVLFEVYKKIKKTLGEDDALLAVTQMQKGKEVPFDTDLALFAADVSLRHELAMADSIVYATALSCKARLVTSDNDFRHLPGIIFI